MLAVPLLAVGFVLAGLIAPNRASRRALLAAAAVEGTVAAYAVLHWFAGCCFHLNVAPAALLDRGGIALGRITRYCDYRLPCSTIGARRWMQLGTVWLRLRQSEDSIGAPQASDGTENQPRTNEVCDGQQGPEKPNVQQQAQAVDKGKAGRKERKAAANASVTARGGSENSP